MSLLPGAFNASEHADEKDEDTDFAPLEAGEYPVMLMESNKMENSKGTGFYWKFVFKVTEGESKGRLLFANLNLIHTNPKAVEMSEMTLGKIATAAGFGEVVIKNTDELHGSEMMVKIVITPATSQYAASNEIKAYLPIAGLARPSKPVAGESAKPALKKKVSFS